MPEEMTISQQFALEQVQMIYEFIRVTGEITTNWFFFAGAVNAAVAGWIIQKGWQPKIAKFTSGLFAVCDSMLAVMYFYIVPKYYNGATDRIGQLKAQLPRSPEFKDAFPSNDWIFASYVIGAICIAMAIAWIYFFWFPRGQRRIDELIRNPGPQGGYSG